MNTYFPNYYNAFRCISKECKHNCCIGWEIDIDNETLEKYENADGNFAAKLHNGIEFGDTAHFRLCKNERCAFLNDDNLCEIIINLGENSLCQICSDHPRFRNFFPNRQEVGLGLCCEAAADLMLNSEEKFSLICDGCENEDNDEFFITRSRIFDLLQDRSFPVQERIENLISEFKIILPDYSLAQWAQIYSKLERLDNTWDSQLKNLESCNSKLLDLPEGIEIQLEQLLIYFIYRHTAECYYDGMLTERLAFAILSTAIIASIYKVSKTELTEIARQYSAEIEYSDENIDILITELLYI